MNKIKFDQNFSFGAATSGPQTEGNIEMNPTVWDKLYREDPNGFDENIGTKTLSGTYKMFEEDIKIAQEIGLNSLRTSIQYARLFDDIETQTLNPKGVEFYQAYFKGLKDAGIKVYVCLFHFDMPEILFDKYEGFMSREVVNLFESYARMCFDLFDEYVDYWITFNEPFSYASSMYLHSAALPFEHNMQKFISVCYNLLITHKLMVKQYRAAERKGEIGTVLDCLPPYPRDKKHQYDLEAARYADLIKNINFLDPVLKGKINDDYRQMVEDCNYTLNISQMDEQLIKDFNVDFVGINYYRPERVKCIDFEKNSKVPYSPNHLYSEFIQTKRRINPHRGWEIYPCALYDIAMRIKNEYGNIPWYVAENGIGIANETIYKDEAGIIDDQYRIDFITEHLYWLHKAIEEGSNCFGFHMWTFIDCWSWKNAYKTRYGFVSLDYRTKERSIKKSGYWIKEVAKTKEVSLENLNLELEEK